jgi:4-diphosphocytidyl-2-C-methyl-D-erythritol kinase
LGIELAVDGNETLAQNDATNNLVLRAYHAFYREFSLEPLPLRATLHKAWPVQGGLGGGSSNAAAMLRYLAEAHEIPLFDDKLHAVAATLGADVAFFLQAQPALALGRGEILSPIATHANLPAVAWLLVKPHSLGISTPWAYQTLDTQRALGRLPQPRKPLGQRSLALKHFLEQPPEAFPKDFHNWHAAFSGLLHNDFHALAWQQFGEYGAIEEKLQSMGCLITLLCGSGATVAGLLPPQFEWTEKRQAAVELLFFPTDYWTCRAMTPCT